MDALWSSGRLGAIDQAEWVRGSTSPATTALALSLASLVPAPACRRRIASAESGRGDYTNGKVAIVKKFWHGMKNDYAGTGR
jgi:hypothetical protein